MKTRTGVNVLLICGKVNMGGEVLLTRVCQKTLRWLVKPSLSLPYQLAYYHLKWQLGSLHGVLPREGV